MMHKKNHRILLWLSFAFSAIVSLKAIPSYAQLVDEMTDESKFYAESKQVNQFFRRFNGEEDEKGNRYNEGDKNFRSNKLRKKYLAILFDEENKGLSHTLKKEFVESVLDKPQQSILDFHGGNWFAEVETVFLSNGQPVPITLFMEIEKDH